MKKMMIALLIGMCSMVASGLLPRRSIGGTSRSATREELVTRMRKMNFLTKNPSGTNCFNRTFEQQQAYEKSFDLKSFLGFEFGKPCVSYNKDLRCGPVKMGKPFRMFDSVSFETTSMSNLYVVTVHWRDDNGITINAFVSEMEKVKSILEKRYEILFRRSIVDNYGVDNYYFDGDNVSINLNGQTMTQEYSDIAIVRHMYLSIANKKVKETDDRKYEAELAKKSQKINIADNTGAELLDVSQPNLEPPENALLQIQEELRRQREEKAKCGNEEYWKGWPMRYGISNHVVAVSEIEGQYRVMLLCERNEGRKWRAGENRACIRFCTNGEYERYDDKGRLEMISEDASDFVELQALEKKKEEFLKIERAAWAMKKGITYEDAMGRSNEWKNVGFSFFTGKIE